MSFKSILITAISISSIFLAGCDIVSSDEKAEDQSNYQLKNVLDEYHETKTKYRLSIENNLDCKSDKCIEALEDFDKAKEEYKKVISSTDLPHSYSIIKEYDIMEINDTAVVYLSLEPYCEDGKVEEKEWHIFQEYVIQSDTLIFGEKYGKSTEHNGGYSGCVPRYYIGDSKDLFGDWVFVIEYFSTEKIEQNCSQDIDEDFSGMRITETLAINKNTITFTEKNEYGCLTDNLSHLFEGYDIINCNTMGIDKNGLRHRLSVAINEDYSELSREFSYKGSHCKYKDTNSFNNSTTSCEDDNTVKEKYASCMETLIKDYCGDYEDDDLFCDNEESALLKKSIHWL